MRVISKRLMPMFRNETTTAVSIITIVANGISAMFNDTLFSSDYFMLIAYFGFSLITIFTLGNDSVKLLGMAFLVI
jgi:hypothetical protein